jgi:hypothetical protein
MDGLSEGREEKGTPSCMPLLTKDHYLLLCRLFSGDALDKNMDGLSEGREKKGTPSCMPSNRNNNNGDFHHTWMVVFY